MGTGYTSDIKDDISFNDFVLSCARAFGACVTMRDSPMDEAIPEKFNASTYHIKDLEKAIERKKELETIKMEDVEKENNKEYEREVKIEEKYLKEKRALKVKYDCMLCKVRNWKVPSREHERLKDFMIEQIQTSIEFDCSESYSRRPVKITADEWLEKERKSCLKDIEYHSKGHREEVERIESRNLWIKQLRDSLK